MATVGASTSSAATAYPNQRKIDCFSNGVLFGLFHDGSNMVCRYSADGGATWHTPAVGAIIRAALEGSVYIVSDKVFVITRTSGGNAGVQVGTPNAACTEFTWTTSNMVTLNAQSCDIMAHVSGTGWRFWAIYGESNTPRVRGGTLAADGTITIDGTNTALGASGSANPRPSIAKHPSQDTFGVTWNTGTTGAGKGIRFRLGTWNGSSMTWGTEEAVTESDYAASDTMGPCEVDDTGRIFTAFTSYSGSVLRFFRRTAGGGWTNLSPTGIESGNVGYNPTFTLDRSTGTVYLCYWNTGGQKLTVGDGSTWSAATVIDSTVPAYGSPSARRDTSGSAVDVLYTTGSGPTYTVKSFRQALSTPRRRLQVV